MKSKIKICKDCDVYTLRSICPICGNPTKNPLPPPFSPQDPYGIYRRISKFGE